MRSCCDVGRAASELSLAGALGLALLLPMPSRLAPHDAAARYICTRFSSRPHAIEQADERPLSVSAP